MSTTKVNWKGVFFYALIISLITIALLYVFKVNPVYGALQSFLTWVKVRVSGFSFGNLNVPKLVTDNWATILGVGATAIPLIYTTVKAKMDVAAKNKELDAAKELVALEKKGSVDAQSLMQKENAQLKDELAKYQDDKSFSEAKDIIQAQKNEIQRLQVQVEDLTKLKQGLTEEQVDKKIAAAKLIK